MTCLLCGDTVPLVDVLNHIRLLHPDRYETYTWPDGRPVIHDTTLTAEDFGGQP